MRKFDTYIPLWIHILMSLAGGPLWHAMWVGHTTDVLNRAPMAQKQAANSDAIFYFFFPVYEGIWVYHQFRRYEETAWHFGKSTTDRSRTYVWLSLLGPVISVLPLISSTMFQHQINQIAGDLSE